MRRRLFRWRMRRHAQACRRLAVAVESLEEALRDHADALIESKPIPATLESAVLEPREWPPAFSFTGTAATSYGTGPAG